jgi:hypothetical protein
MNERVFFVAKHGGIDHDTAGTVTAVHTTDPEGNLLLEPVIEVTFDDGLVDLLTWDDVIDVSQVLR